MIHWVKIIMILVLLKIQRKLQCSLGFPLMLYLERSHGNPSGSFLSSPSEEPTHLGTRGASLAAVKLWIMHLEPWHLQLWWDSSLASALAGLQRPELLGQGLPFLGCQNLLVATFFQSTLIKGNMPSIQSPGRCLIEAACTRLKLYQNLQQGPQTCCVRIWS